MNRAGYVNDAINEYAVLYKFKAADYHLTIMRKILDDGLVTYDAARRLEGDAREVAFARNEEFFWHFEAFLFQLLAAFELVLQELNVRRHLGIRRDRVDWRTISQCLPDDPVITHLAAVRSEDWFGDIKNARHEAAHRGPPFFEAVAKGDKILVMAFHGRDVFQVCGAWLQNARNALQRAVRLMREASR